MDDGALEVSQSDDRTPGSLEVNPENEELKASSGSITDGQPLTQAERDRIEQNRRRALELHRTRVVRYDGVVYTAPKRQVTVLSQQTDSGGGFIIDPTPVSGSSSFSQNLLFEKSEEESDAGSTDDGTGVRRPRKRRRHRRRRQPLAIPSQPPNSSLNALEDLSVPRPPDEDKPICDECSRPFDDSYLLSNFDCQVCDGCRDTSGIHAMITRTSAKERYLLSDVDIDVREPPLRRIFKKNPRNTTWGDMQLFLEAQVAARSLELWGSEEKLEEEREKRATRREKAKLKGFKKKVKELRVQVRSSLYARKSATHEHTFEPEEYDEETDTYSKKCSSCSHCVTFEKIVFTRDGKNGTP